MSSPVPPELRARLEAAGQEHVLRFLDEGKVPAGEEAGLLEQLGELDLDHIAKIHKSAMDEISGAKPKDLAPPDDFTCLSDTEPKDIEAWEGAGFAAVARGEVAACVLAGGQGTRLGYDGPKGCYDIGLPSGKPLFQLIAEKIRRLATLAGTSGAARIPFLVMTSPINDAATRAFFREREFFGLPEGDVWIFSQGTLPCLTAEGKLMLESAGVLATAPDGNAGIYPALQKSGCIARLQESGVKYLHVFSIDNALCRPADPRFMGYCISRDADCGNKCVWKVSPDEKVGVVAKLDGRPGVVEYSELSDLHKNQRNDAGRLVFGAGNICNHFFTVAFLAEEVIPNMSSMFHAAHKKIPFADDAGSTQKPEKNNGIKLEGFIFDVFSRSKRMAILETTREEEFSPVKNEPGAATDSPDTARAMVSALARKWVEAAGGQVEGSADAILEISPLLSYAGEGLKERVEGKPLAVPAELK